MDIDSQSQSETPSSMPRAAKVGHKKSRLGCQRCKTRRVKCDEQKPICGSCQRHGAECAYIEVRPRISPHDSSESIPRRRSRVSIQTRTSASPTADLFPRTLTEKEDPEIPESKARRLMELRLMQNNLLNMVVVPPSPDRVSDEWLMLLRNVVPRLSLEHDNVLYASFTLSATHLLRSNQDDESLYSTRQNYLVLALREQRKECAQIGVQNADAVCLTSVLILRNSFAMMQERSLEQYEPPIEWMKMGRGAGAVMWKASVAVQPEVPASFKIFLDSYQHVLTEQALQRDLDPPFNTVYSAIYDLRQDLEERQAYRQTLAYINSMQRAIDNEQPAYIVGRRLQAFPMVIPTKFIDLVEIHDPCALVVLAYYFGIAAQIDNEFWWLRGPEREVDRTAVREIRAIDAALTSGFRSLLSWPLLKIDVIN